MYNIGDKIFYPMHGAGVIEAITEKEAFGKKQNYYCLRMPIGEMQLMIPVENIENTGLRIVISRGEAMDVIAKLPDIEIPECNNWNKRYRDNMSLLKSGDIMEVARVVKGLLIRENERSLSTGERKMLMSAKNILLSEIVLATDIEKDQAEIMIESKIFDKDV
jgi:CarD family transcriptional regulator